MLSQKRPGIERANETSLRVRTRLSTDLSENPQLLIPREANKTYIANPMPHSISPEESASPDADAIIGEPKPENIELQESDGTVAADSMGPIEQSQASDDQDMTMSDAGAVEEKMPIKVEATAEVKLEDLFADMDSDEEFPSSTGQDVKTSNSPEAPASPL